jgi:WD40 repeat protein
LALWDMATGKRVHSFAGHTHFVESTPPSTLRPPSSATSPLAMLICMMSGVLIAQEGQLLLSASPDKTIRVWDPRAGSDPVGVHITGAPMRAIALSPDGNRIFYAPFDLLQRCVAFC